MSDPGDGPVDVALTERALRDLAEIHAFSVDRWGEATADRYLDDIDAALQRLQRFPGLLREESEFASRLRFYSAGRHYLVCDRIDDWVIVLTVIHASRDLPRRLGDFEPNLIAEAEILHKQLIDKRSRD